MELYFKWLNFSTIRRYSKVKLLRPKRGKTNIDMEIKCRENPIILVLDTPEFKNIFTQEVLELKKIFDKYQYEIRIAGGAVRDILLGMTVKDIDFATTAIPEEMKVMFNTENIRMINTNGEKHGTITPRINDKENFEITTLRIDLNTNGRHAEVNFTKDWKLDANRRDLTINSMFLGFDGSVYDYFFGYDDLLKRRIVFVGDADVRIKEDYLRIMRYFRFYGRIAEKAHNHDKYTLEIIKANIEGLQYISGERIWVEFKKILQGNFVGELLKTMLSMGIGQYIGVPKPNMDELDKLLKRSQHLNLHPMTYLAALLKNMDDVTELHMRLKFSSYDRDMAYFLVEHRDYKEGSTPLKPYELLVLNSNIKQKNCIDFVREVLKYRGDEKLLQQFNQWDVPKFPIGGKILKNNGVPPGKMCGPILKKLKNIWIENDYKQTTEDLIKLIPSIMDEHNIK